jgi:methionine biosynthesis protein MetW
MTLRPDLAVIFDSVRDGSRVLDVGCGNGDLMAALRDGKNVDARGMEIDAANVSSAMLTLPTIPMRRLIMRS